MLDGTGYPDRLLSDRLCLESRILTVADVYAALAEDRPYRQALAMDEILAIIQGLAPHKLDGECVAALAQVIAKNGSLNIYSAGTCAKTSRNMFRCEILTPV